MIVFDLSNPRELVGEARGAIVGLDQSQYVLSRWLPRQEDVTLEYRITTPSDFVEAATYRAWDTESKIARRPGVARISGELPPLSRKIPLGEWENLQLQNVDDPIIQAHYRDARRMAAAVAARIEAARGQALYEGKVTLAEGGLDLEVDFAIPGDHIVAPLDLWSDTGAATIIQDLTTWLQVWTDSNVGMTPGVILTSNRVVRYMARNDEIRTLIGLGNVPGIPALASRQNMNDVLGTYDIPPILTYEAQWTDYTGTTARVIPDDRLLILPAPLASDNATVAPGEHGPAGETLFGVTAESLELRRQGFLVTNELPGIVAVQHFTSSPVTRWTEAVAIALPLLSIPHRVLVATVL